MKFHSKISIITISLVLASGLVSASPAALNLFPDSSSARIDSFTAYEMEVENTGPVKDVYTLSSSSPSEITIAPQKVEVEPGRSEFVNIWYNPRTEKDEGRYSFRITATSRANGKQYSTTGTVEVIKDHQVEIETDSSKTVCRGEKAVYTLEIENTGIQPEEFAISSDFGQLSRKSVNLEDGETAEVTLTLSSDTAVERNFDVVAASKTSYAQDIQSVQFVAENCFDSEVSITPQNLETPAFDRAEIDVTVRNTGTREDTFTLSTTRGQLEDTELEVDAGETETTTLSYVPEQLGNQQIQVTAKGKSETTQSVSLNVFNNMNSDVRFRSDSRNICQEGSTTYQVEVENTGGAVETFNLKSSYGELLTSQVDLQPGDQRTVRLVANSSAGLGTHDVQVTSTASTFGEPVRTATSTLEVENCYNLKMNIVPEVVSAGENRSAIYRIDLNNTGTRQNTYELAYEGPEWIDIRPKEVTVQAGESMSSYMYAGIPFRKKGEVEITATAVGQQVERTETVRLLVGEEIEEAIRDEENNLTGGFFNSITGAVESLTSGSNAVILAISVVVAILVTAFILIRG